MHDLGTRTGRASRADNSYLSESTKLVEVRQKSPINLPSAARWGASVQEAVVEGLVPELQGIRYPPAEIASALTAGIEAIA